MFNEYIPIWIEPGGGGGAFVSPIKDDIRPIDGDITKEYAI